ncbi:hypothetical protein [Antrihabitans stalactiti]|uniref:Uncharacterized protein n=1 Tax=Antrihabitans stalactiti TaxID=2584121 RepID=A0A848KEF5_9NOCA|nr:hypothetical protein [Antrihabitans stalactiti]NMN95514.1 hypothetical protein [Antrihabitans stalactiti]
MFVSSIDPVAAAFAGLLAVSLVLMHDPDGLDFRRREVAATRRSLGSAQRNAGRATWSRRR